MKLPKEILDFDKIKDDDKESLTCKEENEFIQNRVYKEKSQILNNK